VNFAEPKHRAQVFAIEYSPSFNVIFDGIGPATTASVVPPKRALAKAERRPDQNRGSHEIKSGMTSNRRVQRGHRQGRYPVAGIILPKKAGRRVPWAVFAIEQPAREQRNLIERF
jgi:hypothetical protein